MGRASRVKRERAPARTLFHFTTTAHLESILEDRALRLTESNIDLRREHAGPDVVWLMDQPTADDANHGLNVPAGAPFRDAYDKRELRFTVRARAHRWFDWAKAHNIDPLTQTALLASGGGTEAARHWYVSEEPVPIEDWLEVAVHQPDGSYEPVLQPKE